MANRQDAADQMFVLREYRRWRSWGHTPMNAMGHVESTYARATADAYTDGDLRGADVFGHRYLIARYYGHRIAALQTRSAHWLHGRTREAISRDDALFAAIADLDQRETRGMPEHGSDHGVRR